MFRLLAFLAAMMLAQAAAAAQLFVAAPKDGYLNLRAGPSTQYQVLYRMPDGSRVDVLSTSGTWYRIRHETGRVGWASSRFLSDRAQTAPAASLDRYWVDAPGFSGLNLRAGPGTGYDVLMTMAQGSWADELGRKGTWRLLRHESGQVGWAHANYLSDTKPDVALPRSRQPRPAWRYDPSRRDPQGWRRDDHSGNRPDWRKDEDRRGWDNNRDRDDGRYQRDREEKRDRAQDEKKKKKDKTKDKDQSEMEAIMRQCHRLTGEQLSRCISNALLGLPDQEGR